MSDDEANIENLDKQTLLNARLVFETLLISVTNMDFIPEEKTGYVNEIQREIDQIDIELLSRGDS